MRYRNEDYLTAQDFELAAKKILSDESYHFIAGGSGRELSVANNLRQYDDYLIKPNHFSSDDKVDLSLALHSSKYDMPIMVAPMGLAKLCHQEGEACVYSACASLGVNYISSMMSSIRLEDIAVTDSRYHWFQLYPMKDIALTRSLVRRAEQAGCQAIVITVDMPVMAIRLRDLRNRFTVPEYIRFSNLPENVLNQSNKSLKDDLFCKKLSWAMVSDICESTKLPVYLKGIFDSEEALFAVDYGVSGLIISNHGGRQLDGTINPLDSLTMVAKHVKNTVKLGIDGGIRSGRDAFIALLLGADFVLIGRPIYWALASGGAENVKRLLILMKQQLYETVYLSGICSIGDIKKKYSHILYKSVSK